MSIRPSSSAREQQVELEQRGVLAASRTATRTGTRRPGRARGGARRRRRSGRPSGGRRARARQLGRDELAVGDLLGKSSRGGEHLPVGEPALARARAAPRRPRRRRGCPGRGTSRVRPGAQRPLRVVLLPDPDEAEEPSPVELARHGDRGDAADERLEDHRPGARVQSRRAARPCVDVENTAGVGGGEERAARPAPPPLNLATAVRAGRGRHGAGRIGDDRQPPDGHDIERLHEEVRSRDPSPWRRWRPHRRWRGR